MYCFASAFISADIIFYNFLELFQHSTFSFLTDSLKHHPFNGQNLLSVTKVFCQFSLQYLLKYFFFKHLLTKIGKSIFCESTVNCYYTYIFKGSNYTLFGLLFRTYFKNNYFDTCNYL